MTNIHCLSVCHAAVVPTCSIYHCSPKTQDTRLFCIRLVHHHGDQQPLSPYGFSGCRLSWFALTFFTLHSRSYLCLSTMPARKFFLLLVFRRVYRRLRQARVARRKSPFCLGHAIRTRRDQRLIFFFSTGRMPTASAPVTRSSTRWRRA